MNYLKESQPIRVQNSTLGVFEVCSGINTEHTHPYITNSNVIAQLQVCLCFSLFTLDQTLYLTPFFCLFLEAGVLVFIPLGPLRLISSEESPFCC